MRKTITVIALMLAFTMQQAFAQTRIITGKVIAKEDNLGIPGVSVVVEGTTIGTTTDPDGAYKLPIPATAKQIKFSGVGLKPQTLDIGSTDAMDVTMEADVLRLNEVVVTALGIKREEKSLGYAVQAIKGDDLTKAGNTNALSGLSGKIAGVNVTNASGVPGAATNIRIRGATSLLGNNQPLIVIDNVPVDNAQNSTQDNIDNFGPINGDVNSNRAFDINPDDIDDISVLKGPAATALYGMQGASGVILITTKKGGKAGPGKTVNVTYSTSFQWDKVTQLPVEQHDFTQGSHGAYSYFSTRSWGAKADTMVWDTDIQDAFNPGVVDNYDHNGVQLVSSHDTSYHHTSPFTPYDNETTFFKTGITRTNSIALSGGTDKSSFRASFSNVTQHGIIALSGLTKSTVSINGESAISTKMSISGGASYTDSRQDGNLSGNNTSAITYGIYRTPINFDNTNGGITNNDYSNPNMFTATNGHQRAYTYYDESGPDYAPIFDNPYWTINKNPFTNHVSHMLGNVALNYIPCTNFNIIYRIGLDEYSERHKYVYERGSASVPLGEIIEDQFFNRVINSDLIGTYHAKLSSTINSDYSVGTNFYSVYNENLRAIGQTLNFAGFYNIGNTSTEFTHERLTPYRTQSAYALLNFDWKSTLYLGLTGRNDWSSSLPEKKDNFFYPSVNLGFVFTEPLGMSSNKILPFGKIRASYAGAGKDAPPQTIQTPYYVPNILDGWSPSGGGITFPYNGNGGYQTNNVLGGGENLVPEKTSSYELGTDLKFLNNMIGLDFTYYYSKTTNEIIGALPIASSSGFPFATRNAGSIENKGVEIVLDLTPLKIKDFKWDIEFNYAMNRSKVVSLSTGLNDILIGGFDGASIHAVVGQPYGMIYGGHFARDPNGQVIVDDQDSIDGSYNPNYGFPLVATKDSIIGNPNPKWIGGIRNTFTWKGFSLGILFDGKFGFDMHDGTRGALVTYGRAIETDDRSTHDFYFEGVTGHVDPVTGGAIVDGEANNVHIIGSKDVGGGLPAYQYWWSGNGGAFGKANEIFVEKDLHFIKLREITLTYSLNKNIVSKTPFAGISLSLIARNLKTWTNYRGVDPDQALAGASNIQGLEWFNLPNTKSYGLSLTVQF